MGAVPKKQKKEKVPEARRTFRIKANRGIVLLLVILPAAFLFGAGWLGFWIHNQWRPTLDLTQTPPPTPTDGTAEATAVGPWGTLEVQPTVLQIPNECLASLAAVAAAPPSWVFKGCTAEQVRGLFSSAGLMPAEREALDDRRNWKVMPDRVIVSPPAAVLLSLSPTARGNIYSVLAKFPENPLQHSPFYWKTRDEAQLLANPVLLPEARALIQKLSYNCGNLTLFADLGILEQHLSVNSRELAAIQKLLSRRPAVLPQLSITPETDVDLLMHYWGVGGLAKVLQPALTAISRIPRGRTVSLLAVLPPFARARLNTYPGGHNDLKTDEYATAFSFFNDSPALETVDAANWSHRLNSDYFEVFTDPRYGDVVVVSQPNGDVVQTAVYLADNLVFTRNGPTPWDPWLIMSIPDLLDVSAIRMPHLETSKLSYFRNRNF